MTLLSTTPALVTVPGTGGSTYTATFKTFTNIASPGTVSELITIAVYYIDSANQRTVQIQKTDYITKNPQAESIQIEFQGKVAPVGSSVTMVSSVPYTQIYSFPPSAPVDPAALELALDRIVMMSKQNYDRLNNTVGLENPPTNAALRLIVPEPIVTKSPIYWEQDPTNASRFILRSADFTIDEFRTIYLEILAARDEAVAAAAAAAASAASAANSAVQSATSAASSAQTYADIQIYGTQLRADMEVIKDEVQDDADAAAASAAAAAASEQNIEDLVARFPSPVGQPIDLTYVTDGQGAMTFQRYNRIVGMDTATEGQVITVHAGPNGNELIAASPITTSEKVGTYNPIDEGGTSVSAALINHERRLDYLENTATIFPYGKEHAIADFIVNVDGNLRNAADSTVVLRDSPVNIVYEQFGDRTAYWTSGNNFTIPGVINGRDIFHDPGTMMFGIYVDANTPDTVIFSNTALIIKKITGTLQFLAGTLTKDLPLILNQWVFYSLSFNGTTINGHSGEFNAGVVTVTDIADDTLVAPIANEDLGVNMENNLRLVRLTFVDAIVTKTQFETWIAAIYGIEIGTPSIPDPSTGQNGQAIVIESGSYALRYPLLLDPIAAGYTVDNSMEISAATPTGEYVVSMDIDTVAKTASFKTVKLDFDIVTNVPSDWTLVDTVDASTQLNETGLYNWWFKVDATAKTITLEVSKMNPTTTPDTILFTATPTPGTPQVLAPANPNAANRLIQNYTKFDIVIGSQAQLTSNVLQGLSIRSGDEYATGINTAIYVMFPAEATGALPAGSTLKVFQEVLS